MYSVTVGLNHVHAAQRHSQENDHEIERTIGSRVEFIHQVDRDFVLGNITHQQREQILADFFGYHRQTPDYRGKKEGKLRQYEVHDEEGEFYIEQTEL